MALKLLLDGCSVRSTERLTGLRRDMIIDLMLIAGERCDKLMNSLRNVKATDVQADKIWSFIRKKAGHNGPTEAHDNNIGDCYCWVAMERTRKWFWLIP